MEHGTSSSDPRTQNSTARARRRQGILLLAVLAAAWLGRVGVLQVARWLEQPSAWLKHGWLVRSLEPKLRAELGRWLPFELEEFALSSGLAPRLRLRGTLAGLGLQLLADGPITLEDMPSPDAARAPKPSLRSRFATQTLGIRYTPALTLTTADGRALTSALVLTTQLRWERQGTRLLWSWIGLDATLDAPAWDVAGVNADGAPARSLQLAPSHWVITLPPTLALRVHAQASSLDVLLPESDGSQRAFSLAAPALTLSGDLATGSDTAPSGTPKHARPIELEASARALEAIDVSALGETRSYRLALERDTRFSAALSHGANGRGRVELRFVDPRAALTLDTRVELDAAGRPRTASFALAAPKLDALARRLEGVLNASGIGAGISVTRGAFEARGRLELEESRPRVTALTARLRGVSLGNRQQGWAVRGVSAQIDRAVVRNQVSEAEWRGSLAVDSWAVRGLTGRLAELPWIFSARDRRFATLRAVPLEIDRYPVEIGVLSGAPSREAIGEAPGVSASLDRERYLITTRARARPFRLDQVLADLCVKTRFPTLVVDWDTPLVEWGSDWIDTQGWFRARVFGGQLIADSPGLFGYLGSLPELLVSARWSGLDLGALGRWFGFGKMDGQITGELRDVVLKNWLPTRFGFRVELKPRSKRDIVFSPDAMRNFVKLVSGGEITYLPGIANWMAFGWPSRVFGGYDIDYAGIELNSRDGTLVLSTLDPDPENGKVQDGHYILYGTRFKIPLRSKTYPVLLDSVAVNSFLRNTVRVLQSIQAAGGPEAQTESPPEPSSTSLQGAGVAPTDSNDSSFSTYLDRPADCPAPEF